MIDYYSIYRDRQLQKNSNSNHVLEIRDAIHKLFTEIAAQFTINNYSASIITPSIYSIVLDVKANGQYCAGTVFNATYDKDNNWLRLSISTVRDSQVIELDRLILNFTPSFIEKIFELLYRELFK
jgi:hypothetical protein